MPNEFLINDTINKLILINKIQKAEIEIKESKDLSTIEAKEN